MDSLTLQLLWWAVILIGVGLLGLALVFRHERRTYLEHVKQCPAHSESRE